MRWSLVCALVLLACAPSQPRGPRFANRPIVWRVDDRVDVPVKPKPRPFAQKVYYFDAYIYNPVARALAVPRRIHALDVNALDEVPDSTWFTNRIGHRDLAVADLARGPNTVPPDESRWTVVQSKTVGGSPGFIALDGRGDRYVLKLDEPDAPITESATDVAVQRLLSAIGYNVPENSVIYLGPGAIALADTAVVKDEFGNERPMVQRDLDHIFARGNRKADGTYRFLASRFLAGAPLGGFPQVGTRRDDPNDKVPHEHMRVLRALRLFFAWLQQTDAKEDNTLDMWIEDKQAGRHYLLHYLVDFGKSLGISAWITRRPGDGHQENVDFSFALRGIAGLGLWVRPYEGTRTPGIQGVGMFDAEHYDPGAWKPHARYEPMRYADDRDHFWAGKIIARFTREQLRAALEQGRYEDPRAVDYLTDVLVARQWITVRWAFTRSVAPLDRFTIDTDRLCFTDLLLAYKLDPAARATTRYTATARTFDDQPLAYAAHAAPDDSGRACLPMPPAGPRRDGYTIVKVVTSRGHDLRPVEIHIANADGGRRIIGIHRHDD